MTAGRGELASPWACPYWLPSAEWSALIPHTHKQQKWTGWVVFAYFCAYTCIHTHACAHIHTVIIKKKRLSTYRRGLRKTSGRCRRVEREGKVIEFYFNKTTFKHFLLKKNMCTLLESVAWKENKRSVSKIRCRLWVKSFLFTKLHKFHSITSSCRSLSTTTCIDFSCMRERKPAAPT